MDPHMVADVMCFNLEIAQTFAMDRNVPDAFYKSMANSFTEMTTYISQNGLLADYRERMLKIYEETQEQNWLFEEDFSRALDIID